MKAVLTQAMVEKLRKDRARVEVWDERLRNFHVQVRESGVASFYIRYKLAHSNAKHIFRVGDAGVLSVAQARALAQALLARVAQGEDPAQEKRESKDCPTLDEVFDDFHLPFIRLNKKSWKTDEVMYRCHIRPRLGAKSMAAISPKDIEDLMLAMRDGGKGGKPKGKSKARNPLPEGSGYAAGTCNLVVVMLRYIFNLAMDKWQLPGIKHNPATKVQLLPLNNARQVFLSPEQIGQLLGAAATGSSTHSNQSTLHIVTLLVLTGARKSNVLQARWAEVDENLAIWNIPMTKSGKPQKIQLCQEVLTLLKHLPSRGRSEFLFPNPQTRKPFTAVTSSWDSMRKAAGLSHVRMHDLRHTFASLLINGGASLFVVQDALGHSNPKITMRYAHLAAHTQRAAVQNAASLISSYL